MKYLGKMKKMAVKFMHDILKMDPNERPTAIEALRHPYFKGLNNEFMEKPTTRGNAKTTRNFSKNKINARVISLEGCKNVYHFICISNNQ